MPGEARRDVDRWRWAGENGTAMRRGNGVSVELEGGVYASRASRGWRCAARAGFDSPVVKPRSGGVELDGRQDQSEAAKHQDPDLDVCGARQFVSSVQWLIRLSASRRFCTEILFLRKVTLCRHRGRSLFWCALLYGTW